MPVIFLSLGVSHGNNDNPIRLFAINDTVWKFYQPQPAGVSAARSAAPWILLHDMFGQLHGVVKAFAKPRLAFFIPDCGFFYIKQRAGVMFDGL